MTNMNGVAVAVECKTVNTFTAHIYVGLRERYTGEVRNIEMARRLLVDYVQIGLCVTLSETEYLYKDGQEPGFVVGLINYPRFPASSEVIRTTALDIAGKLLELFKQGKVTVVFPDTTVMLAGREHTGNE